MDNEELRTSRRVSFANNLLLRKSDGTTQMFNSPEDMEITSLNGEEVTYNLTSTQLLNEDMDLTNVNKTANNVEEAKSIDESNCNDQPQQNSNTNYQIHKLREQIENAMGLVMERSLFTDFMKDAMITEQFTSPTDQSESTALDEHMQLTNLHLRKDELEEQIECANNLMLERSYFTDFMKDAMMYEDEKIKSYFNQHNRNVINLKMFNNHIALQLELETQYENEYSNIRDMSLVFDFNRPKLKLWKNKFYLFYTDRREHKTFIQILKNIIKKQFNQFKVHLLNKYNTTEFLNNIAQETELFLQKFSVFAKDIKVTTLKFKNYNFEPKKDDTFE